MPVISLPSTAMGPFGMPMVPGNGSGGGGGGSPVVSNQTITNSISSASGGSHTYALSGSLQSFGEHNKLATNGTYTIVSDDQINITHTGAGTTGSNKEILNAGWAWVIRNSDGAVMKSWNGMLNGDYGDSSNLVNETDGGRSVTSKFITAQFGMSVGINDNYFFTGAPYRPVGGSVSSNNYASKNSYIFAYKLSDFSLVKVWKVNDFSSQLLPRTAGSMHAAFGSGLLQNGITATNDGLYIPASHVKSTFTDLDGGAVVYFDISDADPNNWGSTPDTVIKNPINIVSDPTTNWGQGNYSNGNFGQSGAYVYDTKLIVAHATRAHNYNRSGTSFTEVNSYTPNYYIGDRYQAVISTGKVPMVNGSGVGSTLILRDPSNSWSTDWTKTLPGDGYPGYNVHVDIDHDKILSGDGFNDANGTDDGLITVYNSDGTVHATVNNPTSANTKFGKSFVVKNAKLVATIEIGGSSSAFGLQFMDLGYGTSGGGGGTTFGGKSISQIGTPWVFDGPDANSAVDVMTGLRWVDSGNKLVAAIQTSGSNNSYGIYEFDTTTAYSTQTADISYNNVNFLTYNEIADADFSPKSIEFNADGSRGYFGEDNEIFSFSMSTNYDISTATGTGHTKTGISHSAAPYGYGGMEDIKFNSDGTKMFISEVSGNDCNILEFSLSSAYDVTTKSTNPTATFVPTTAGNSTAVLPSIHFNSDGTKMWAVGAEVGGAGVRWLYEYDLSTGFDVSTMSYNNEKLDLETLYGIDLAQALTFNNDFSKIYIACGNDGLFEFQWGTGSGGGGGGGGGTPTALTDGWVVRSDFTSGIGNYPNNEKLYAIDGDSSGNIYVAGYDAAINKILVAQYDKDGSRQWTFEAGGYGSNTDRLEDTAVDTSGNMISVGYTGASPLKGIVVKHASDGTHQWTKTLSDGGSENWLPLAGTTDSSDNIYVTGATEAQSNSGNRNPFVVKINSSGVVQWVKKYDHGGQQSQAVGIALDSNGDIFVSGSMHEQITGGGYSSGMVMKLSGTDGSIIWNKFFDDEESSNGYHSDQFQNCAITPEGDVLTCGWTNKNYLGTYYGVVLKLSGTDGSVVWQRHTNNTDGTKKIAVNSAGKIYTFGDNEVLFVYASDGTLEQEWKITGASNPGVLSFYLEDIFIDHKDNAVITGFWYPSGANYSNGFIVKLPAIIQAGTSGDFVITAQSLGDSAGELNSTTFTSYTANTMSNVTTGTASNLTPSSISATTTGPNTVTGVNVNDAGFYSRIPEDWTYSNGQSDSQMRGHSTKQAPDGSYYTVGRNISGDDSSWLIKRDSTGAFVWIRAWGNRNMRALHIVIDSSSNPICISYDYGYYEQAGTGDITSHIIKFDSSGAEQYKKTFKYTNASTSDHGTYLRSATIDAWDNIWGIFTYNDGVTSPQNYSKDTIGLARIDTSDGSIKKVYTLPPSGTFSQSSATTNPIHIDENNRMYLGWQMYSPTYASTYYGVVARMDITENGDPTYVWTKRYGTNNSTQANGHDFAKQISTLSTGEVIVAGYSKITYLAIPDSYSSSHPFGGTLMSLSATDGSVNWSKGLDPDITDDQYSMAVTDDDKIFVGITDQITYGDNIQIREINSSTGAHVNMWDFNNEDSSTWRYFVEEGTGIQTDNNGNIIITVNPFVGGTSEYYPDLMKLPKTIVTGTFGSTTSGLSGGLILSTNSNTPSDFTYNPPAQTFSSYSTVTDVTSGFGMYAYNSGSGYNDTVFTPTTTVTPDVTVIEAAGGGSPQGWISTIEDELKGYGYTDLQLRSLDVDSSGNIIAAGDSGGGHTTVVKIKSDGTVDSAASFGANSSGLVNRSVAVDSSDNIFTAGEGPSIWSGKDGHVMRLTSSLTKSFDDFFGEGYNDEHFDIVGVGSNAFAVGESQSYAQYFSQDPKGHLIKYDANGGVTKTLISRSSQKSYPQGISTDGTNVYVISKDVSSMWIAKVNNTLSSVTWGIHWGSGSAESRIMDIDTNSSGESAAYMWESGSLRIVKTTANGTATWRKYWDKASTDHGAAYAGYDYTAGYGIKLLANGSVALRAGSMPWTTDSYRKSFYIVVFDSTGTVTVQKEFRLTNSSYFLGHATKSLVELSDGKIVTAVPYYTGSDWKNAIFKFDPTDTTTAINGTHGDWEISDITDGGVGNDTTSYGNGTVNLDSNMSMYFKSGATGYTNGFSVSSATVVEGTQQTLGGGGGGGGVTGGTYDRTIKQSVDWSTIKGTVASTVDSSFGFNPSGYTFNNDGTRMYVCTRTWVTGMAYDSAWTQVSVAQYHLSTAYDISTATYNSISNTRYTEKLMGINDIIWNNDGTKLFIAMEYENQYTPISERYQIWECACSSAYDVSGLNVGSPTVVLPLPLLSPRSLQFSHDGMKIFAAGDTAGIFTTDLTTAYSLSGVSLPALQSASCVTSAQMGLGSNLRLWGITFSNDGKIAFITQQQAAPNNQEWKLTLATAYDLTSYSNTETLSIGSDYVYDQSLITYNNVTNNVAFGSFSSTTSWNYYETGSLDTSGGGSSPSYFGDKALFAGSSNKNPGQIDTLDITTTGNATNFGSLGRYAYAMAAMSNGTRAVFAGGDNNITAIEYVTFATYSAPVTFGSTLATSNSGSWGSVSDGTYGVYPANMNFNGNSLEYITIATTGNGTDFGDMYVAGDRRGGASDGTYGLISGGRSGGPNTTTTQTDRITIATPGNATDFGDNTLNRMNLAGMGDGTYAVFAGGLKITQPYAWYNTMEYFTVATPGNATDFGDLVTGKSDTGATNNATRGVIAGGTGSSWQERDTIDYITIATPSNATSFGNLPTTKAYPSGTSGT